MEYSDACAHLTDRIEAGGVASTPLTYGQAQRAAEDPVRWVRREVRRAAGREAASAAVTGAASAAVLGGIRELAVQTARVRAGETSPALAVVTGTAATARAA
ncbi:hypothetical protein, partial [Streptomyces sp. ISL-86]|uniref:hypothetical protein n=2 Tax=Streptomyces TaxID=1883 RepID=UPI001BE64BC0